MICTDTYHEITEKSAFVLVELLLVQYHLVTKTYDFLRVRMFGRSYGGN